MAIMVPRNVNQMRPGDRTSFPSGPRRPPAEGEAGYGYVGQGRFGAEFGNGLLGRGGRFGGSGEDENARREREFKERQAMMDRERAASTALGVGGANIGYGNAQIGTLSAEQGFQNAMANSQQSRMSLDQASMGLLQQQIAQGLQLRMEDQRQGRTVNPHGMGAFSRIVGY